MGWVKSFQALLDKYHDIPTNPAAEPVSVLIQKMNHPSTDYYFIQLNSINIGAVRVVRLQDHICRISQIFILPEYQGKGLAQQAILRIEELYPQAAGWQLDTIKEETKLCHLYEKMGYIPTGKEKMIQDGMTLVYYAK